MIRELSALVGLLAFALMAYRLVSTWDHSDWLTRALAGGVMALLLGGALGSATYAANHVQGIAWVQWVILSTRVVAVIVALSWPYLVGKTALPFLHRRT